MRRLLIALAVVLLLATLTLGYLGFVPVVSTVFGSDRPRDLGISWTQADLDSARVKTSVRLESLPADANPSLTYEGVRSVNASFTSAELTALLNSSTWRDHPLSDCQIRINSDGTIEGSGVVLLSRLDGYAAATGMDDSGVQQVRDRFSWVRTDPPVYFRAQAQVVNNRLTGQVFELQVGKMPVPGGWLAKYQEDVLDFLQERYTSIPGLRADQVSFDGGKFVYRGTLPAVERTAP